MTAYVKGFFGPPLRRRQAKLARSVGESPTQVRPSRRPGSECCVSRRRRRPRSVHSGCVGCVIEPRNGSSQERRPCRGSNATRTGPPSEAMRSRCEKSVLHSSIRNRFATISARSCRLARCSEVGSYLGYTGHVANVVARTALDPKLSSAFSRSWWR
jgi:hypothetical protein